MAAHPTSPESHANKVRPHGKQGGNERGCGVAVREEEAMHTTEREGGSHMDLGPRLALKPADHRLFPFLFLGFISHPADGVKFRVILNGQRIFLNTPRKAMVMFFVVVVVFSVIGSPFLGRILTINVCVSPTPKALRANSEALVWRPHPKRCYTLQLNSHPSFADHLPVVSPSVASFPRLDCVPLKFTVEV